MKPLNSIFRAPAPAMARPVPGIPEEATGPRIMAIGHSHLGAFRKSWTLRERQGKTEGLNVSMIRLGHKNFGPEFEGAGAERRVSEALRRRLIHVMRRDKPEVIVAVLMGNEYNSLAMVRHPQPYDLLPRTEGLDPDLAGVPEGLMARQLADLAAQNALLIWNTLAKHAPCPIYLLPPPPPIADETHIRSHPGQFGALVDKHGLNPAPLRRRMWELYCRGLAAGVADHPGTTFVDLPEELFEDGFLAEAHWQGDPTHGNAAYGEALWSRLLPRLEAEGVIVRPAVGHGADPA